MMYRYWIFMPCAPVSTHMERANQATSTSGLMRSCQRLATPSVSSRTSSATTCCVVVLSLSLGGVGRSGR